MREIVWRIEDDRPRAELPGDPETARARLEDGNATFAALFSDTDGDDRQVVHVTPDELGVSTTGQPPAQRPFAAVLACADARAPVELLLSQRANDLFVVRVAGGVLSEAALGSLDFAIGNLPTVRLTLSLGHTGCGAVVAAVTTYLDPGSYLRLSYSRPLLALVQNLLGSVRLADSVLREVHGSEVSQRPGYRAALTELGVIANAGANAVTIRERVAQQKPDHDVLTAFGVYDLLSREVGLPGTTSAWAAGLVVAPDDVPAFVHLMHEVAFGPRITGLLEDDATSGAAVTS